MDLAQGAYQDSRFGATSRFEERSKILIKTLQSNSNLLLSHVHGLCTVEMMKDTVFIALAQLNFEEGTVEAHDS